MKPQTVEWVEKAEGDWNAARQLQRVRKDPNYDSVCFHCQQSIEKYLKARLEEAGIAFPRTHDLIKLLSLAVQVEPKWTTSQPVMVVLSPYAIAYRYPGFKATKADAQDAIKTISTVSGNPAKKDLIKPFRQTAAALATVCGHSPRHSTHNPGNASSNPRITKKIAIVSAISMTNSCSFDDSIVSVFPRAMDNRLNAAREGKVQAEEEGRRDGGTEGR